MNWNRSTEMADLIFGCTGATAERYAATPTLAFQLAITERSGVRVHAIALRCQIRIEPHRRRYSPAEARRLHDLFGDPSRWADSVKPIQLATVTTMVPSFTAVTEVDLQVPCTYDLEVASARYLHGLDDGHDPVDHAVRRAPVFIATDEGYSVELVPWGAWGHLPDAGDPSWQGPVVDIHFPGSAWLRCSHETVDALSAFKAEHALPTWDATLGALLREAGRAQGAETAEGSAGPGPPPLSRRSPGAADGHPGGEAAVNLDAVRRMADAVLCEGYILYPYRASAQKEPEPLLAVRRRDAVPLTRPPTLRRAPSRRPNASLSTPTQPSGPDNPSFPAGAAAYRRRLPRGRLG